MDVLLHIISFAFVHTPGIFMDEHLTLTAAVSPMSVFLKLTGVQ